MPPPVDTNRPLGQPTDHHLERVRRSVFGTGSFHVRPETITTRAEVALGFDYKYTDDWYVTGGDWDVDAPSFGELDFSVALDEVAAGSDWAATAFYERVTREISAGASKWGCRTIEDFDVRLHTVVEAMVEEMRRVGYLPNNNRDQVAVMIGRNGEVIFYDGRHRLRVAQHVGVPTIPVVVVGRHPDWVEFARAIEAVAARRRGRVETPILHPDLSSVPSTYGHRRFELIAGALPAGDAPLVDLAAGWGYFCERFDELGRDVHGLARDDADRSYLERLRRASGRTYHVHSTAAELTAAVRRGGDVLVLGDELQRVRSLRQASRLARLVGGLDPRALYVETTRGAVARPHRLADPSDDPVVAHLTRTTALDRVEVLGPTETGRLLLRLRPR